MNLTIITPVLRPIGALEAVRSVQAASPHPWALEHRLCYWQGEADPTWQRVAPWLTGIIGQVQSGWLLFVDDDNRLHPELPQRLFALVSSDPLARAFVFDMQYPEFGGGILPASPHRTHPGGIDGGQVALWWEVAHRAPWPAGESADGRYLQTLYRHDPSVWRFIKEPLTYHNAQRWDAPITEGL